MDEKTPICYLITGPGPKVYVGKTVRKLAYRWQEHRKAAQDGVNTPLYAAIRKYGADAFVVEVVLTARTEADAFACERALVMQFRAQGTRLYNLNDGGEGPINQKVSEETKAKMSKTRKGRPHSEAHRAAIGAATRKWWASRTPTEAQRKAPIGIPKSSSETRSRITKERWQRDPGSFKGSR